MGEFTFYIQFIILLLVFLLSILTYHFVEQPFRKNHKLKIFLQLKSGFLALAILFTLAIFLILYIKITYISNVKNNIETKIDDSVGCFTQPETLESTKRCSFGDKTSDKIFVVYGDSHAGAMIPVFEELALEYNYRGIVLPLTGCPPLFNVYRLDNDKIAKRCKGLYSDNMERFLEFNKDSIDHIFLVARWTLYEKGWIVNGRLQPMAHFLSDSETKSKKASDSAEVLKKGLIRTVDKMTRKLNIQTTILAPFPVLHGNINYPNITNVTKDEYITQRYFIDSILKTFQENDLVNIIDPINIFCPSNICNMYENDVKLYIDDNHVSQIGAFKIFPLLESVFKK